MAVRSTRVHTRARLFCLTVVLAAVAGSAETTPAPHPAAAGAQTTPTPHPAAAVFAAVSRGLTGGDAGSITPLLAGQVSMSLRTGEQGYYSASQASVLLAYYLRTRKISNLVFSTIGENAAVPYATGSATLLYRGNRHLVQVYVTVARTDNGWCITQLNIY